MRDRFPYGKFEMKITEQQFRLRECHAFLGGIRDGARAFKKRQEEDFEVEGKRWRAAKLDQIIEAPDKRPALPSWWSPKDARG